MTRLDGSPFLPRTLPAPLVLASRSPRRFDILTLLGFQFEVHPASNLAEEGGESEDPLALPELLARCKASAVAAERPGCVVLAADTLVILEGEVLSKPANDRKAIAFLRRLSGETHTVVTGVAIAFRGDLRSCAEHTLVTFRDLEELEIEKYVSTGEGRDKAGSYAAQGIGAGLIRRIDGCFYNVVGLPIGRVLDMLREVSDE